MKHYNLILDTDSYKASHYLQYPPEVRYVSSYIEARGQSKDCPISATDVLLVFFGLQAFIKEYLLKPITREDIDEAADFFGAHGEPFNREGWEYILETYGYLPIKIWAVPEGRPIPQLRPMVRVENTDPKVPWVTSYIETALLRAVWYPTSVATISREIKKLIYSYLSMTAEDPTNEVMFKLHDFGARGASSRETAALGGAAHIVNFMGTDTVESIVLAQECYGASMPAFSVPAAEHSTITSWGRHRETEAYKNMLVQFAKPGAIVACVSDSYDIYNAVENIWGNALKEQVLNSGATLVVRPDSGVPSEMVLYCVSKLGEKFGYTVNKKGYKVLNPSVRVIQGDGVDYNSIRECMMALVKNDWSVENVTFGMGGALLQKVNRDTFKFAMKASAVSENGVDWKPISKSPVTDSGKRSKEGRQTYIQQDGEDLLELVYHTGHIMRDMPFDIVRNNATIW